jgi:hypothetical protein
MNILMQAEFARFLEQLRHPDRRSWIIMNPCSIGDTAFVCALAREFVKQHGHGITMVVPPDHLPITAMFPNRFIRVLTADRPTMLRILNQYIDPSRFELDMPFCAHSYDHGDCRTDALMYLFKFPGRGGLSMADMFRHLLRLPWDACLDRPTIPPEWETEAQSLADTVGMDRGRSITLFPASSSPLVQLPDILWSTLVARLTERGYKVFCNMKGGHFWPKTMPIAGSIPIEIPVHLALPLVSFAGRAISSPNGMQFLALLGGRFEQMTVLAPATVNHDDFQLNERTHSVHVMLAQYMFPELCLGVPFEEYLVPHEASDDELVKHAIAVADQATDVPIHVRRLVSGGKLFIDEHHDWLKTLVQPLAAG